MDGFYPDGTLVHFASQRPAQPHRVMLEKARDYAVLGDRDRAITLLNTIVKELQAPQTPELLSCG